MSEKITGLDEAASLFATPARRSMMDAVMADTATRRLRIKGLEGSAPAMLLAAVRLKDPALVVADDADAAGYLYHDLCQILGEAAVAILPSAYKRDIRYGQIDPPSQILRAETLEACEARSVRWIVSYPEALAEKVPAPAMLGEARLKLRKGKKADFAAILAKLREEGFRQTDYVYEPGQFAVRGSILDIYSFSNELPYRVDFFDDEIDSIRTFNVETQLSEQRLDEVTVIPAMSEAAASGGIPFTEFLNPQTPLFLQSVEWTLSRIRSVCSETISDAVLIADEGDPDAMEKLVDARSLEEAIGRMRLVEFGVSGTMRDPDATLDFDCSPQASFHKNFNLIADSFTGFLDKGYRILILSDSPRQTDRLRDIFEDRGDDIRFTPVGRTLHQGFVDHDTKTCFFTDHQIFDRFHKYNLRSDRARGGKLALSLKELAQIEPGDYIVHIDHGLGKFAGLVRTDVNGRPQEMIKLLYQNDDIILVSIHSLHKLSKYRGKEGAPPKISKLGSGAWHRLKEKTKTKVKEIARDLIRLYAARREQKGFPFSPATCSTNSRLRSSTRTPPTS